MSRSLVALQRALGAQARSAGASLSRFLSVLVGRLAAGQDVDREQDLVAAAVTRIQAAGDLSGRIDLRFGAEAPEAEDVAPAGPLATVKETRRATSELRRITLTTQAAMETLPRLGTVVFEDVPRVPFAEAVRDLESRRDLVGAEALRRAGEHVARAYAPTKIGTRVVYPHAARDVARATDSARNRIRKTLAEGLERGVPTSDVARQLAAETGWAEDYARTVARTVYSASTTEGRFVEAEQVKAAGIAVGFRFVATDDSDVRRGRRQDHGEDHLALDGLVARADDPIWASWSPPLGFNCRCSLEPVIGDEVPRGPARVPYGAAKAPGFGGRSPRS